jgi:hypothetical protein
VRGHWRLFFEATWVSFIIRVEIFCTFGANEKNRKRFGVEKNAL